MSRDLDSIIDEALTTPKVSDIGSSEFFNLIKESFNDSLSEVANTVSADVNEILLGYYIGGGDFGIYGEQAQEVQDALKKRASMISEEEYKNQSGRAAAQAKESLKWASNNGYEGSVKRVWWTARPGVLGRAVGVDVESRKNPTDILLQFSSDSFLGLSAKSTKGSGDIAFKNPGIGRLGRDLGLDLSSIYKDAAVKEISKLDFGAATNQVGRKKFLKNLAAGRKMTTVPEIEPYYIGGAKVLKSLRDALLSHYYEMDHDEVKEHFLDEWIDAKDRFPYYVKVTGFGRNGNFSAKVEDPLNNEKMKKLSSEHIGLGEIGNNSIGVYAGDSKIFKIRFKFESTPLASNVKLSGDPWK